MEDYREIPVSEKQAWHLDPLLNQQIANDIQGSAYHFLKGNIETAFYSIKAIRHKIVHCLKSEERTSCFALEKSFKSNPYSKINQIKEFIKHKEEQFEIFDKYNTLVMDFLGKYGFVGRKMEDNTNINT